MEYDWFKSKTSIIKSQDIRKTCKFIENTSIVLIYLDKIRNYFGDNVAFYFAFLEFYTKALIPTSVLGTNTDSFLLAYITNCNKTIRHLESFHTIITDQSLKANEPNRSDPFAVFENKISHAYE